MKFKTLIYREKEKWFYVATHKLEKEIVEGTLPTLYPPEATIEILNHQADTLQGILGETFSLNLFKENLNKCELIDVELNAL